jgi:hypothetical protein
VKKILPVLVFLAAACGPTGKQQVEYVQDGVVDCTTAAAQSAIETYQNDLESFLRTDRAQAEQLLRGFGKTTGACVLANIVAGVVSGKLGATATVGMTAEEARALFDRLRREHWDGATYKTDAGVL